MRTARTHRYSLIVPVYRNELSITPLVEAVSEMAAAHDGDLEAVFVVDGSPDRSAELLRDALAQAPFSSTLVLLARNFGSFSAIRAGLREASGEFFAVMAADLQEPPELVGEFFRRLSGNPVDVVVGTRRARSDPALSRFGARIFWGLYRRFVQREMPRGGVDVFACNRAFRDRLLELEEANSSLVGLIFWLGFRRELVPYDRRPRTHGRSAWTLRKKARYLADSIFSFTDFPVRLLAAAGAVGMFGSAIIAAVVLAAKLAGSITVPGYTPVVLTVAFLGALNCFGLGIIGSYVWRAYENTKGRPDAIVMTSEAYGGGERR